MVLPREPGRGQFPGGRAPPEDHVRQDIPRLPAQLAEQQDVPDLHDRGQVDHAAHVQHQQELFIVPVQREDVALLRFRQQDIPRNGLPVRALAGDPRQDVDGRIPGGVQREVILGLRHHGANAVQDRQRPALQGRTFQPPDEALLFFRPDLPVAVHPCLADDAETGRLQPVLRGDEGTGIDLPGTRSAFHREAGAAAVKRQAAGRVQRERAVRSQQHRAFRAEAPQDIVMLSFIIVHFRLPVPVPRRRRLYIVVLFSRPVL